MLKSTRINFDLNDSVFFIKMDFLNRDYSIGPREPDLYFAHLFFYVPFFIVNKLNQDYFFKIYLHLFNIID